MRTLQAIITHLSAAVCLAAALGGSSLLAQETPRVEAEEALYDFGQVYRGALVKHYFTLYNSGADTLVIKNVRSSCGCTVGLANKLAIGPGESTSVEATFDTGRYAGRVSKDIFVQSNDPVQPITKLTLTGEVQVDLTVNPVRLYFSGLKEGDRIERRLSLLNSSEQPLSITEVSSTVSDIRFELPKLKLEPGESTELILVVDKVTKDTRLTGSLTIHVTGQQKEVTVQLYGGTIN